MATRTKPNPVPEHDLDPDREEEIEELEDVEVDPLEDLRTSDATIYLYRVIGGQRNYLDAVSPLDMSLEIIKANYGGGTYQAQTRKKGKISGKAVTFRIEGEPRAPLPAVVAAPPVAAAPALTGGMLEQMLQLQLQQQQQLILALQGMQQPRGTDWKEILTLVTTGLGAFKELKGVFGGGSDIAGMIEGLKTLDELRGDRAPGESSGGGGMALAAALPGMLREIKEMAAMQNIPPGREIPVSSPVPATSPEPAGADVSSNPFAPLAPGISFLMNLARVNADEAAYATVIETQYPDVAVLIKQKVAETSEAEILEQLVATFPVINSQREWFAALLHELVTEPEEE